MNNWNAARAWSLVALFCLSASALAQNLVAVPERRIVTDLTATLSEPQQNELTQKLRAFETRKGSQIALLIVPTTGPETIEQYALRVSDSWKLGRKGVDDGALLVIAKKASASYASRRAMDWKGRCPMRSPSALSLK